jgi:hypothetical protein
MDAWLKDMLWGQFGGSVDMLDDAVSACPERLWTATLWVDPEDARFGQFWSISAHALRWSDIYLAGTPSPGDVQLPPPFDVGLPEIPFTQDEVRTYLQAVRKKAQATFENLTDERAQEPATWGAPYLRQLLMSARHVQEHASQLSFYLGQNGVTGPDWVAEARD